MKFKDLTECPFCEFDEYVTLKSENIKLKTWKLTIDEKEVELLFDVKSFGTRIFQTNSNTGREYALFFGFKSNSTNANCVFFCFEEYEDYKGAYNFVKKSIQNDDFVLDIIHSDSFKNYSLFYE